jgi:eukaryotic-like serine/threonine-protein kinase
MAMASGTRLGPYEIQSPLGAGGMGEVYRARDTRLDRDVAIKVLSGHFESSPSLKERFEREARTISQLSHPHICHLYDVGSQDGTDYLVMECLEGETLSQRLERGPLPLDEVLRYGAQVADALDKAHQQGVIHRDLKPGNIMLTKSGAKVLDFGLAKQAQAKSTSSSALTAMTAAKALTVEGTIVGTFQYMAPEQIEGTEADARSDIFALGCVLYEMATGKRAFAGKTQASVIAAILATEPAPLSRVAPMTPPALDRLVRSCMAKDYASHCTSSIRCDTTC